MQAIVSQLGMEGILLKGIDHLLVVAYTKNLIIEQVPTCVRSSSNNNSSDKFCNVLTSG